MTCTADVGFYMSTELNRVLGDHLCMAFRQRLCYWLYYFVGFLIELF